MEKKPFLSNGSLKLLRAALVLIAVVLVSPAASGWAAGKGPVAVKLTQRRVMKGPGGKETYTSAAKASPGDVIEYTAAYTNNGKTAVTNLMGELPVPAGTQYVPGTARPAKVMASIDGVKFLLVPLKRKVRLPNGKEAIRDVPYSKYKFLGWQLGELPAGKTVTVSARVRLASAPGK